MPRKKKLPVGVRIHGSGFRAVVATNGERSRSPVLPTPEAAAAWRDQFLADAANPAPILVEAFTLQKGLDALLLNCRQIGTADCTPLYYRNVTRRLFAGLGRVVHQDAARGPGIVIADVTKEHLRDYVDARLADGVKAATIVAKELRVFRRLRRIAIEAGHAQPDPFVGLVLPKVRTERFQHLPQDRIAQAVETMRVTKLPRLPLEVSKWHADLVALMFGTGLRRAEVARLSVRDVDFAAGLLHVQGKTGLRDQTFGATLEPVLRRLVARADKRGRLVPSARYVGGALRRWQGKLGGLALTPHVLRHSFATAMAEHVQPFQLMVLMGHASLKQTSQYYHGKASAVRGALDNLQLQRPRLQTEPQPAQ